MSGDFQPLLPAPIAGDPEDVAWALQTAHSLWKRGEYNDAVSWIRRAANAAADADHDSRVIELAKAAAELSAMVEAFGGQREQPPPMRLPSGVDIEVDVGDSSPPPADDQRPPSSVPSPNQVPSTLRAVAYADVATAAAYDGPFGPPPAADPIPPSVELDSARAFPSVPPSPPDFAPTPMAMPIAKTVPPDREGPRPDVTIAPDVTASRTVMSPLGTPDFGATFESLTKRVAPVTSRQVVETDAVSDSWDSDATTEMQRAPLPLMPESQRGDHSSDVVTSARAAPPARPASPPRVASPFPGNVPPPKMSLASNPLPVDLEPIDDIGIQRQVSAAPPRFAHPPSVPIPAPPRPASVQLSPTGAEEDRSLGARAEPFEGRRFEGFPSAAPPPPRASSEPAVSAAPSLLDPALFESLADVPADAREALVQLAEKFALLPEEATTAPAMVMIVQGEVEVRAPGFVTRLDVIRAGQIRMLLAQPPAAGVINIVGGPKGARYLSFGFSGVERLRATAPWLMPELETASDDVHVVAGVLRGRHGARLDGVTLNAVLRRAKTMRLAPNAKVVNEGEAVRALIVNGAGELTIRANARVDSQVLETVDLGEVLFATELLGRRPAPATVRAGERGALVIVATRGATEELLVTVPSLLEVLGDA